MPFIIVGVAAFYFVGGLFVKNPAGQAPPAIQSIHWKWPKTIFNKIFK
jgi:hypothetical protein